MQPVDDILPLYTGVVRLKSYGKGEDVHVCRSRRSHLVVLTPDAIQLFTTSDAGIEEEQMTPALSARSSSKSLSMVTSRRGNLPRISLRHLLSHSAQENAQEGNTNAAGTTATIAPPPSVHHVPSSGSLLEDPEDLAEGQVFRLGVALNQVIAVEIVKESRLIVFYQPNRPSKKGTVEEQTLMVLRSLLRTVDVTKWRESGTTSPPASHLNAHHFTIVMDSKEEATSLKDEIERTQKQLARAVLWLSEGLPLRSASSIVMVTIGPGSNGNGAGSAGLRGGNNGNGSGNSSAPSSAGSSSAGSTTSTSTNSTANIGGQAYVIPYPSWNSILELPNEVSSALASPSSRRALTTSVKVYISTPLGPATAEVPLLQLMQSAAEGSAPMTTAATLRDFPEAGTSLRPNKRWDVLLQWRAEKGETIVPQLVAIPGGVENSGGSGMALQRGQQQGPSSAKESSRGDVQQRGGREVALARGGGASGAASGAGSMAVLVGLAALSGVTAVARRVRTQISRLRGGGPLPPPGVSQPWHRWKLTLLELSIDYVAERSAQTLPAVRRHVSVTLGPPPTESTEAPLPHHIVLLMQQYPKIITPDIARRFIVGLGSENKAFTALSSMAQWMTENRLWEVVRRPQPAFKVMKRHYPHGFPGWSRKKDCLVEVECMGQWPRSYEGIAGEGVSEQAMLEHLLFIYQYAFSELDTRPLPDGKTIKIVDLDGLTMSDLRTQGFKLITRVGSMLSMNFPQRLNQCYLINAPGWWAVAWKIISPMIPAKIRGQMSLFGKNDKENARRAMLEWVDEDVLPVAYGGKNALPMNEWPMEVELARYVEELNAAAGGNNNA